MDHADYEASLQRQLMYGVSLVISIAGVVWGSVYVLFYEIYAAMVPYGYSVCSLVSAMYYARTRDFDTFRKIQLSLILLCPFFLMLLLGGFHNGSVVFIWAIMAPFGALLYYSPNLAPRWLAAYLGLLLVSGLAQTSLPARTPLPESFVVTFYVLNIGIVSSISFALLYYFVRGKNQALELLRLEQEKSERLLLNVLPKEIAPALKDGQDNIAEYYPEASVLFADIVGFTQLSARMNPREMVAILNDIFSYFDTLVEQYGLEKIRTIGDNYMVASGVPVPRKDHAAALADMAVDLRQHIRQLPEYYGMKIDFRVGINSGPLVAGVIGRKKFHYDIWGDTVNIASRMESTGEPGRVQITTATYGLIHHHFHCTPRGTILVKGKGEMQTWYLHERKRLKAAD